MVQYQATNSWTTDSENSCIFNNQRTLTDNRHLHHIMVCSYTEATHSQNDTMRKILEFNLVFSQILLTIKCFLWIIIYLITFTDHNVGLSLSSHPGLSSKSVQHLTHITCVSLLSLALCAFLAYVTRQRYHGIKIPGSAPTNI